MLAAPWQGRWSRTKRFLLPMCGHVIAGCCPSTTMQRRLLPKRCDAGAAVAHAHMFFPAMWCRLLPMHSHACRYSGLGFLFLFWTP